jgi:hypothetical protein
MTKADQNTKENLVKATECYFDLLLNSNDQGYGFIGKLITKDLNEANELDDLYQIITSLHEYNLLLRTAGKNKESALLDMIITNIDEFIEKIENQTA